MKFQRLCFVFAACCLTVLTACSNETVDVVSAPSLAQPTLRSAAVAMPDTYAAQISEDILSAGGNAVDAAIAVGFSLAVTYPEAGNIGGGGFMLLHVNGEDHFLDYRERAPLAAGRDMYLDDNGEVIEGASVIGHLSVGVPGTVAGMWAAHEKFGTMPWRDLVMPAVMLAEEGFVVGEHLAKRLAEANAFYGEQTNFNAYFKKLAAGDVLKQKEMANTLRRIAERGTDGFYSGETAALIVAEMQRGSGLITLEDLAQYTAKWREPLSERWREYQVLSAPPPSSGGFAIVQLLKIKDYNEALFNGVRHNSAQYVHLVAEIEKRVFADRAQFMGDPDFVDNRIDKLLSEDYIKSRAVAIDPQRISPDVGPGLGVDQHDTTHYSILDKWGNAVSNSYTLNLLFGSGVVVSGAGFLLNDEMDDFSVKPGVPNVYGVVGSQANEIQPGKRMLSSMSPTILLKDGEVAMVVGTPGGSTIFTSVFQTIVNVLDFKMTPVQAIGATRFHHQLLPKDEIMFDPAKPLPEKTVAGLADLGYHMNAIWDFGDMQLIVTDGDSIEAASDPRHRGESRVIK